jgi:hypothetical protein
MLGIMRTTVNIDDRVLSRAKRRARGRGVSLGKLVEEALRRELSRRDQSKEAPPLPVFDYGGHLRPGIDPTSNRSMLEALDEGVPLDKLR